MNKAERKIKAAYETAVQLHRQGSSPNDSIVKVAGDMELNPEMTRRVVEMFNINKTNSVLGKVHDKTASFPIAQIDTILKEAFVNTPIHTRPKVAREEPWQQAPNEADFSIQHDVPSLSFVEKTADITLDNLSDWIRQANGLIVESNQKLSNLNLDVMEQEARAHKAMERLVEYFSTSNNEGKFAAFEGEIMSEYGEDLRPSLDIIYDLAGLKEPRHKGHVKLGSAFFNPTQAHREFDTLMDHTSKYHGAVNAKTAEAARFQEMQDELTDLIFKLAGSPEAPCKIASDMLDFGHSKKKRI